MLLVKDLVVITRGGTLRALDVTLGKSLGESALGHVEQSTQLDAVLSQLLEDSQKVKISFKLLLCLLVLGHVEPGAFPVEALVVEQLRNRRS